MGIAQDMLWFKSNFGARAIEAAQGTAFSLDLLTALAFQETGSIWGPLSRRSFAAETILKLCTGDTIDFNPATGKGRSAFPRNRAALEAHPRGGEMFQIARAALLAMAAEIPGYSKVIRNPDKFCHGYGIFQYDIQFFKTDPDYFLNRDYEIFEKSLAKCIQELKHAQTAARLDGKANLTDLEAAACAIAYNTGKFRPERGLKQGFSQKQPDGSLKFYGEFIFEYIRIARTVAFTPPSIAAPARGVAPVAGPSPVTATGKVFRVATLSDPLKLRSAARLDADVKTRLPRGTLVRAFDDTIVNGFRHVQANLQGARFEGFAAASLLKEEPASTTLPVTTPVTTPPVVSTPARPAPPAANALPAVHLTRRPGAVTRRTDPPNQGGAHRLSEANMPGRTGTTPDQRRAQIADIVRYLDSENPAHLRYQPGRVTFCNIYAHDFCALAGVYLPRVWWSAKAVSDLRAGLRVEPAFMQTVDEVRANALFVWLRDFGLEFGWQRTSSLTKLQTEVNQGAVGLICARNKVEGVSGHIVAVVPEMPGLLAKRDGAGEVTAPVQSQAGRRNFRFSTSTPGWWRGDSFADAGFWLHQ